MEMIIDELLHVTVLNFSNFDLIIRVYEISKMGIFHYEYCQILGILYSYLRAGFGTG